MEKQILIENAKGEVVGKIELNDDLLDISRRGLSFLLTPIINTTKQSLVGYLILPPEAQPREPISEDASGRGSINIRPGL